MPDKRNLATRCLIDVGRRVTWDSVLTKAEAFLRCSYLAKARGKGYGGTGTNNYSGSRVRFKNLISTYDMYF